MAVLCWLCMAACCCSLVRHLQLIVSGIKDVLDTLITGSSRKRERFPAGGFQTVNRIFVGQFQKPHTTAVGLLFYTLGGKDRIYYLTGTGADPLRPFAETVTVPFQILLVGLRHMLCNRTVLPFTAIKTAMGRNPVVIVKNLNSFICNPYINFALYIFIRN